MALTTGGAIQGRDITNISHWPVLLNLLPGEFIHSKRVALREGARITDPVRG